MGDQWYNETEETWVQTLVGRRIVKTETRDPEDYLENPEYIEGIITLDDGTELAIIPNKGGCSCCKGDYYLTHLEAGSGSLITSATITYEEDDGDKTWELFVMCEGVAGQEKIMTIEGNDGSGYYGTGYLVKVTRVD